MHDKITDPTERDRAARGEPFAGEGPEHAHDCDVRTLLDGLGMRSIEELKDAVDLARVVTKIDRDDRVSLSVVRRDVHPLELLDEPDGVLESMANGDLSVTDRTRHYAQAELDYRRERQS